MTTRRSFLRTNILGTSGCSTRRGEPRVARVLQISDGRGVRVARGHGRSPEESPLAAQPPTPPANVGDLLVRAYGKTFGLPVLVTRCSNNYGPYQFPRSLSVFRDAAAEGSRCRCTATG